MEDRGSLAKNLQRTPRERGSEEVAGTPADKEELRQRLENSREDWGTPGKTAKLRGSLGSSSDSREAPATKNFKGEHREGIAKASRRRDNCRETGRAVGKLASLSRTEGTSVVEVHKN